MSIGFDDLVNQMLELKAKFGPKEDLYRAAIVPYPFYSQMRKQTKPTNCIGLSGIRILPLGGMPDGEGLMFKYEADAHHFIKIAEQYGYEEAKRIAYSIISLKDFK